MNNYFVPCKQVRDILNMFFEPWGVIILYRVNNYFVPRELQPTRNCRINTNREVNPMAKESTEILNLRCQRISNSDSTFQSIAVTGNHIMHVSVDSPLVILMDHMCNKHIRK
jgi:hypothetical protein